jgi:hypothetical protein
MKLVYYESNSKMNLVILIWCCNYCYFYKVCQTLKKLTLAQHLKFHLFVDGVTYPVICVISFWYLAEICHGSDASWKDFLSRYHELYNIGHRVCHHYLLRTILSLHGIVLYDESRPVIDGVFVVTSPRQSAVLPHYQNNILNLFQIRKYIDLF